MGNLQVFAKRYVLQNVYNCLQMLNFKLHLLSLFLLTLLTTHTLINYLTVLYKNTVLDSDAARAAGAFSGESQDSAVPQITVRRHFPETFVWSSLDFVAKWVKLTFFDLTL